MNTDGRCHLVHPDAAGRHGSQLLPGFWLQVDRLWQELLPPALELLQRLNVG